MGRVENFYRMGKMAVYDEGGKRTLVSRMKIRRDFHIEGPTTSQASFLLSAIMYWQNQQLLLPVMWCEGYYVNFPDDDEPEWLKDPRWFGYEYPVSKRRDGSDDPKCPYCDELGALIKLCFGDQRFFNGLPFVQYFPYPFNRFRVHFGLLRHFSQFGNKPTLRLIEKNGIPRARKPLGTWITGTEWRNIQWERRRERHLRGVPDPKQFEI